MTLEKLNIINNIFVFISLFLYFVKNFYLYKFIKKDEDKFGKFLLNICNLYFILVITLSILMGLLYVCELLIEGNRVGNNVIIDYTICGLVEINIIFLIMILRNIKRNKIFKFMFIVTILELIFPVFSYIVFYVLNYTIYYNSY